jgi:outer membrane protein assembly factor BamC
MLSKKIFLLFVISALINGCGSLPSLDEVLPDNRTKYQKSRSLPELEVPPDLTNEALNDPLAIPDEENATTLSEFERRKVLRQGGQLSDAEMALLDNADEKWLVVQGTTSSIWPKLREFWVAKGFEMDLDDAELGVMETLYKEISTDGVVTHREKFKIFSEEGGTPGNLVIFLSSERQENISGSGGSVDWIGQESSDEQEKELISELNVHFYGVVAATNSPSSGSKLTTRSKKPVIRAEIINAGEGKEYLTIPDEFSRAWRNIEDGISESGMYIEKKDLEKGVYIVVYYADIGEEKKGFLTKLKFWKSDDDEGKEFHISLTGVGDKTEVVVLDDDDKWEENSDASRILSMLQSHYNRLLR